VEDLSSVQRFIGHNFRQQVPFFKWLDIEGSCLRSLTVCCKSSLFLKGSNHSWAPADFSASACYEFWGVVSWCWSRRYLGAAVCLTACITTRHGPLPDTSASILLSTTGLPGTTGALPNPPSNRLAETTIQIGNKSVFVPTDTTALKQAPASEY